jgi:hypothetical protein
MRPLLVALAACLFAAAPAASLAQQTPPQQQPVMHPIPPVRPPRPVPTHAFNRRGNLRYPVGVGVYPTVLVNADTAPKHKPTPRPKNAEDVFETHSTNDAK